MTRNQAAAATKNQAAVTLVRRWRKAHGPQNVVRALRELPPFKTAERSNVDRWTRRGSMRPTTAAALLKARPKVEARLKNGAAA
jgi:hypothetical protein